MQTQADKKIRIKFNKKQIKHNAIKTKEFFQKIIYKYNTQIHLHKNSHKVITKYSSKIKHNKLPRTYLP
jgi:hypothetical protein